MDRSLARPLLRLVVLPVEVAVNNLYPIRRGLSFAAAVAAGTGVSPATLSTVTTLLVRQKVLVKLDTLTVHRDALDRLKQDMAALKAEGAGPVRLDVATFKERYAMSRKFAIPLLEYLDRERVTRRVGDTRLLI